MRVPGPLPSMPLCLHGPGGGAADTTVRRPAPGTQAAVDGEGPERARPSSSREGGPVTAATLVHAPGRKKDQEPVGKCIFASGV